MNFVWRVNNFAPTGIFLSILCRQYLHRLVTCFYAYGQVSVSSFRNFSIKSASLRNSLREFRVHETGKNDFITLSSKLSTITRLITDTQQSTKLLSFSYKQKNRAENVSKAAERYIKFVHRSGRYEITICRGLDSHSAPVYISDFGWVSSPWET